MHRRVTHRSLLSLLMIWQLLASVLAHPLPSAMSSHDAMHKVSVFGAMQNDCPNHQNVDLQTHGADQAAGVHACHAACKCPCAGTPALVFALPSLPVAISDSPLVHINFHSLPVAPVANLLRPPIA